METMPNLDALKPGGQYKALTPATAMHWGEFKVSCDKNSDCSGDAQKCTNLLWEAKDDGGKTYANGVACYDWDETPCIDTLAFASVNTNYETTKEFSKYNQYQCTEADPEVVAKAINLTVSLSAITAAIVYASI